MTDRSVIRTPDQRLRVFVSSTLQQAAEERAAAREAITHLRLAPVTFELGARPHPPRDLYRAYLDQSHLFVGIYWQKYGWVAPGEEISGLEDEYRLSGDKPKLIYIKTPASEREPRLKALLDRIKGEDAVSYKYFSTAAELRELIENDLAMTLSERFEQTQVDAAAPGEAAPRLSNLPTPRNALIDREQELALACDLLCGDRVSLLTLTGPGGSGKSRLGLHIAHDLLNRFADGAFLVRLTPITDPNLVVSAIAQTLDVRETTGGQPLVEGVKDYLRNKHLLLLLDNFEQVISAAPLVGELLETCPRLKVLVTSRAPLRLRAERELPVPPLALPDIAHLPDVSHLSQYAAVELFIQRASSVKPDFAVTNANAPVVAEICHRLDGLPLAIELAAARIRILSPQALLARLGSRLEVLTGGACDLPVRQQTLRSAIAWSYDLLSDRAKTLFRRLAVFAGGWALEAAEAVCNLDGDLGADVLDELEALVDNNLLKPGESLGGEPRFRMLETIREYALERLKGCGEESRLQRRHIDFFMQLAEEAEPHVTGGQRGTWLDRLAADHDNLRAALARCRAEAISPEVGLQLAGSLDWLWFFRGFLSEGRAWLEGALAQAKDTQHTLAKAKALSSVGGWLGRRATTRRRARTWRRASPPPVISAPQPNLCSPARSCFWDSPTSIKTTTRRHARCTLKA